MIESKQRDWVIIYLVFYIFWGWIFTYTVYANSLFVYLSFVGLLVAFFARLFRANCFIHNCKEVKLWLPFFLYVSFSYLLKGSMEYMSYWLIAALLIMTSQKTLIIEKFPYKFVLYSGLFVCVGILMQLFLPSTYNSNIAPLYMNDNVLKWVDSEYGFSGFTYQLAMSAEILVYALIVLLSFGDRLIKRSYLRLMIVFLLIVCVFLTGKRMNSLIALVILFMYLLYRKKVNRILIFILFFIFIVVGISYFISHAEMFENILIFKRFASMVGSTDQSDFDSGRSFLWKMAIEYFKMNPFFGIGPGKFSELSRVGTDVHNIYIQCLCEYGLVGMLIFSIPLLKCMLSTFKLLSVNQNSESTSILFFSFSIQLNYILEGITENTNTNLCGYLMYAIAITILIDYKYRYKNEPKEVIF